MANKVYRLIVKNSKVVMKLTTDVLVYIFGIKDVSGTGNVSNGIVDWSIQHKTKTTVQWDADTTTVLLLGQLGIENTGTNTFKLKIGDGVSLWAVLGYAGGGSGGVATWGTIIGTLADQTDLQSALNSIQLDINTHEARTDNPHSVTKTQVGLSSVDNTSDANKPISIDTQAALDLKLDAVDYVQHFLGLFTTLIALQTAYPTADVGDYAQVDPGSGTNLQTYSWDVDEGWVLSSADGSGANNTDELPEGATNLYFTNSRAQTAAPAETETTISLINHAATEKTTLVDGDELTGQDSEDSFSLFRVTLLNIYNYLKAKFDSIYQPAFTDVLENFVITGTTQNLSNIPTFAYGYYLNGQKVRVGSGGRITSVVGTLVTFANDETGEDFEAVYKY